MSEKELREEVVRMIKQGNNVYFLQNDLCRILNLIKDGCESLNAKAKLQEAIEIFSCIVDPLDD